MQLETIQNQVSTRKSIEIYFTINLDYRSKTIFLQTSASPSRSQSPVTPTIIGPEGDVKKPTFQNVRNCFLSDGKRIIDYVLAYDDEMTPEQLEEQKKKRAESSGVRNIHAMITCWTVGQ